MTDKEKLEAIKAEIEKLKLCTMDEHMKFYSEAAEGEYNAFKKVLEIIDSLPEESVSDDVKEAASKYATYDGETISVKFPLQYSAFIEGAQWQKEQIMSKAIVYNDKIYPTTYENEPTEFCLDGGEEVRLITEAVNSGLLKQGDKVRVIIVKED